MCLRKTFVPRLFPLTTKYSGPKECMQTPVPGCVLNTVSVPCSHQPRWPPPSCPCVPFTDESFHKGPPDTMAFASWSDTWGQVKKLPKAWCILVLPALGVCDEGSRATGRADPPVKGIMRKPLPGNNRQAAWLMQEDVCHKSLSREKHTAEVCPFLMK